MPIDWLIFAGREKKSDRIVKMSFSESRSLVPFFLEFHIVTTGSVML
jgi:hypothetical protein